MRRAVAVAVAAVGLLAAAAGCASPARHAGDAGAVQTGLGGAGLPAAEPSLSIPASGGPVVRLGFVPSVSVGVLLVGVEEAAFSGDLGPGIGLEVVPFSNESAESSAIATGRVDAAYLRPVAARTAWQESRRGVRIIAGAPLIEGNTAAVPAVRGKLLVSGDSVIDGVLKGQIQATELLDTDQTRADAALAAELAALNRPVSPGQLVGLPQAVTFTNDPQPDSTARQAQRAAAAGAIRPVGSLNAIHDLGPLSKLLRAAGQLPVAS
jgi:hypothetical protein